MMDCPAIVVVSPASQTINADLVIPGSKSYSNRALIISALAEGTSVLDGVLQSDDTYWCLDALKRLGIYLGVQETCISVQGCGGRWPVQTGTIHAGSAGTVARFLPGALAAAPTGSWVLDGSDQLRRRPIDPLVTALRQIGARIDYMHAT